MSTEDAFHCFIFGCLISSSFTYVLVKSKFFYWVFPLCWISHSFCQVSHLHCLFSYLGPHWIFCFLLLLLLHLYVYLNFLKLLDIIRCTVLMHFSCFSVILIIEALWDFGECQIVLVLLFHVFLFSYVLICIFFGVDQSIFFPYQFFCFILCGFSYLESSLSHQATRKNIFKNPDTKMQ